MNARGYTHSTVVLLSTAERRVCFRIWEFVDEVRRLITDAGRRTVGTRMHKLVSALLARLAHTAATCKARLRVRWEAGSIIQNHIQTHSHSYERAQRMTKNAPSNTANVAPQFFAPKARHRDARLIG